MISHWLKNKKKREREREKEKEAKRTMKRQQYECTEHRRRSFRVLASVHHSTHVLLSTRVGGLSPLSYFAVPPCPLSPPCTPLCKSSHMLPRVPVSQRHSRASFLVLYLYGFAAEGRVIKTLTSETPTYRHNRWTGEEDVCRYIRVRSEVDTIHVLDWTLSRDSAVERNWTEEEDIIYSERGTLSIVSTPFQVLYTHISTFLFYFYIHRSTIHT